jgi:alpha-beta hydrolase superfamily lysophospholipase
MKESTLTINSRDGSEIHVYKWIPDGEIRGVVQIAHGMSEHAKRYDGFANVLTLAGYAVYANDHRGHGRTANSPDNLGHFSEADGWSLAVDDLNELTKLIKEENKDLPIILLGHSMGSFLAKSYVQKYGKDLAGLILSGTGTDQGLLSQIGILVAKYEMWRIGKKGRSKLLNNLSFGNFNKPFNPNRTEYDWLSRDEKEVDKYVSDPYCGGIVTAGFFYDMLTGIKHADRSHEINKVPKNLPIFIISGDKDPVGGNTKLVLKTIRKYQAAGIEDLKYKFYPEARHELLNELNKEEVFENIIEWINTSIFRRGYE